jgi:hypothetical protein
VIRLRDKDTLPDAERLRLLNDDPGLRILSFVSLESYLLADDVLAELVAARGGDCLVTLRRERDDALSPDGSAKASLGAVFDASKLHLADKVGLGENKWQFAASVLAALVRPGMASYEQLTNDLQLPKVGSA